MNGFLRVQNREELMIALKLPLTEGKQVMIHVAGTNFRFQRKADIPTKLLKKIERSDKKLWDK